MVKPPKSMQPEAVDMEEVTKKGTRGMGGDDFRNYMARKIDLQRKQFGVVLPPPPPVEEEERKVRFAATVKPPVKKKKRHKVNDMSSLLKKLKKRHGKSKSRKRTRTTTTQQDLNHEYDGDCNVDDYDTTERVPQHSPQLEESLDETDSIHSDSTPASSMMFTANKKPSPSQMRQRPDLFFLGICVLVNGYTDPDADTIMRLLHKHGGDLEKYETTRVTHIIASHLSTAKAHVYKRQRQPRPVCRPEWIVDSVNAGKLLPHGQYLIQEVQPEATNSVKNFFGSAKAKTVTEPCVDVMEEKEDEVMSLEPVNGSSQKRMAVPPSSKASNDAVGRTESLNVDNSDSSGQESSVPSVVSDEDAGHGNKRGECIVQTETCTDSGDIDTTASLIDSSTVALQAEPLDDSTADAATLDVDKNNHTSANLKEDKSSPVAPRAITGTSFADGRIRTVGSDPNFLDSYFSSSRLSFIGSFKQRARASPTKRANTKKSKSAKRFVFLVDMDSFFASVVLRNYPEYRDKPVAISHMGEKQDAAHYPTHGGTKNDSTSSSECATCNYEARKYGITKGMYLGRARELCPELVVLQYDFEGYEEVSEQVADILYRVANVYDGTVEQVSCDESYVELFLSGDENVISADEAALKIAESIRKEVFEATQCTATVGVASNKFLAKLAADQVKPNKSMVVDDHRSLLEVLKLRDLHGIGYRMEQKLAEENLVTVCDVWDLGDHAEGELIRILGAGLGKKIYLFCQGKDDRQVKPAERKTIGAECNYGVRFDGPYGVDYMVEGLAKEVQKRMEGVGVKGSRVTLKIKQRKQGAKPPPKFLGHGSCHNLSKSADTVGSLPTKESSIITRIALSLLEQLAVPADDIRGMGIVMSKLTDEKSAVSDGQAETSGRITSWFGQSATKPAESTKPDSSRRALLKTFEHAEAEVEVVAPAPATAPAGLGDHTSSPPTVRSEEENEFKEQSGESIDLDSEETMDRNRQASAIALSQLEQEFVPDESESPQNELDDDIALPSFSQLHMSQVAELPSPMRKSIIARVSTGGSCEMSNDPSTGEPKLPTSVTAGARSSRAAPPPLDRNDSDHPADKGGANMKQLSLKRMMKLAAVKSGKDTSLSDSLGGSVSLTQLECLPLEMQLQVANNEELLSGYRSPSGSARKKLRRSSPLQRTSPVNTNKTSEAQSREGRQAVDSNDQRDGIEELPSAPSKVPILSELSNFYQENIAPLKAFMDANPDAEDAALQKVKGFLCLCVTERRFNDAVKLLRSIKNRDDAWSNNAYQEIREAVNEHTLIALERPLDLKGLAL